MNLPPYIRDVSQIGSLNSLLTNNRIQMNSKVVIYGIFDNDTEDNNESALCTNQMPFYLVSKHQNTISV